MFLVKKIDILFFYTEYIYFYNLSPVTCRNQLKKFQHKCLLNIWALLCHWSCKGYCKMLFCQIKASFERRKSVGFSGKFTSSKPVLWGKKSQRTLPFNRNHITWIILATSARKWISQLTRREINSSASIFTEYDMSVMLG